MELKITTNHFLKVLHVISWILFIGLCIEAGSIIFNAIYTFTINPEGANYFKLNHLYQFDTGYYIVQILLLSIPAILKAFLFYLIVKLLHDKKLNLSQPFNADVNRFISNAAYITIGISLFSHWASENIEWMLHLGVTMPNAQFLDVAGADVWLFMGITLLVIAQIFKKGLEIQTENELTI